jgi:hypothetical protein
MSKCVFTEDYSLILKLKEISVIFLNAGHSLCSYLSCSDAPSHWYTRQTRVMSHRPTSIFMFYNCLIMAHSLCQTCSVLWWHTVCANCALSDDCTQFVPNMQCLTMAHSLCQTCRVLWWHTVYAKHAVSYDGTQFVPNMQCLMIAHSLCTICSL